MFDVGVLDNASAKEGLVGAKKGGVNSPQ